MFPQRKKLKTSDSSEGHANIDKAKGSNERSKRGPDLTAKKKSSKHIISPRNPLVEDIFSSDGPNMNLVDKVGHANIDKVKGFGERSKSDHDLTSKKKTTRNCVVSANSHSLANDMVSGDGLDLNIDNEGVSVKEKATRDRGKGVQEVASINNNVSRPAVAATTPSLVDEVLSTDEQDLNIDGEGPENSDRVNGTRGRSKGVQDLPYGKKLHCSIINKRFCLAEARTQLGKLFRENLRGPYTTFKEFPKTDMDTFWARFKSYFTFDCSDQMACAAFNDNVKRNYTNWMYRLRNDNFTKYKTRLERCKHPPEFMSSQIWRELVNKWSTEDFLAKSQQNTINRQNVEIYHTSGSVPFAERRANEELRSGKKPSPFEMWFKLHTKDGKWKTEKAKKIYENLLKRKEDAISEGLLVDEYKIYGEEIGPPKQGIVKGFGKGIKPSEVYASSMEKGCTSTCQHNQDESIEKLKDQITAEVEARLEVKMKVRMKKLCDYLRAIGLSVPSDIEENVAANEAEGCVPSNIESDAVVDEAEGSKSGGDEYKDSGEDADESGDESYD